MKRNGLLERMMKFSAVGFTGILVQSLTLALLLRVFGMHYLAATAIAVETSVLHNFVWHRKWTWRDRPQTQISRMLLRFNLTSGAMSLAGNLVLMWILVGNAGLNAYAANMTTIALCSLVNFTLSDRFVFI